MSVSTSLSMLLNATTPRLFNAGRESYAIAMDEGFRYKSYMSFARDPSYTLYRDEDFIPWVVFFLTFAALFVLDHCVMNRTLHAFTIKRACFYTLFWILCAFGFAVFVRFWYGSASASMWCSGYLLEWMLSFDNLFVFHIIFNVYNTPDHLKHKPLYIGICGAILFRLVFILVGEYLMHAMYVMHVVFGTLLIYTGVKTVLADDEDEDPSQHAVLRWLQTSLPFVKAYDEQGKFFVRVPKQVEAAPEGEASEGKRPGGVSERHIGNIVNYGTLPQDVRHLDRVRTDRGELHATMLVLVVCCLELSDVIFAVDSVSAIVAQVDNLFLAYSSAVFAMLGLRATFFIINELVKLFSLLKYGVSAVLVFIGVKLMLSRIYHVPSEIVCVLVFAAIGTSMVASIVVEHCNCTRKAEQGDGAGA